MAIVRQLKKKGILRNATKKEKWEKKYHYENLKRKIVTNNDKKS